MTKDVAYLDQHGILHVVDSMETAKKHAVGEIVEFPYPNDGGYPTIEGKSVIGYAVEKRFYLDGNEKDGTPMDYSDLPEHIRSVVEKLI